MGIRSARVNVESWTARLKRYRDRMTVRDIAFNGVFLMNCEGREGDFDEILPPWRVRCGVRI